MERDRFLNLPLMLATALTGIAVTACVPAGTEAYTTPWGTTYLNGSENNPAIVAHEQQHRQDYQDDPLFFWKYSLSPEYRCEAEKRANEAGGIEPVDDHPACQGVPK